MSSILLLSLLQGISLGDLVRYHQIEHDIAANQLDHWFSLEASAQWQALLAGDFSASDSYTLHLKSCLIGYLSHQHIEILRIQMLKILPEATDPVVMASCIATAGLIAYQSNNFPLDDILREIFTLSSGLSDDYDQALRRVGHVVGWGSEMYALRHIYQATPDLNTVPLLVYMLMRKPQNLLPLLTRLYPSPLISMVLGALVGIELSADIGWQQIIDSSKFEKLVLTVNKLSLM